MLTILYIFVNTITLVLFVDRTYEFINGTTIPNLRYWTYAQMDVAFTNPMQSFKVM